MKLKTLYGSLIVILVWYLLHYGVKSAVIPSPHATFVNFVTIFPTVLAPHMLVSLYRILVAIAISLIVGVAIGLWVGVSRKAEELISPIIYILYPLPKIAFLPVLMILFGLGDAPKIILIIIIIIFQIILAARDGVQEIPRELLMSVKSLGLTNLQIYRHLLLPAILPQTFTALRISIGVSIAVLFFGENFATTYGIGYFIMNSWIMINYLEMFSGIVALGIVGILLFRCVDFIESQVCRWVKIGKNNLI